MISHRNLSVPLLAGVCLPLAPGEVMIPLGLEEADGKPCFKQEETKRETSWRRGGLDSEQTELGSATVFPLISTLGLVTVSDSAPAPCV